MNQLYARCPGRAVGAALAAAVFLAAAAGEAAYVITTQGQRIDGTDIRAKLDGTITLVTAQGTRTFMKGQYAKAVADKPPEIDRAAQLVEAKKYDEAIKLLEEVALRYRHLEWDIQALMLLPRVHAMKGDMESAVTAYEKLFAMHGKSREDSDVQWAYFETLLGAGQYDKLEKGLEQLIASGSRTDAARAYLVRGDIRTAQNQLEMAVLDYLRPVVLFASERSVQPMAMLKTAETLEKLRDSRAKEWYKKLVEQFPSSPEANAARAKL